MTPMKGNGTRLTLDEARQLLGLKGKPPFRRNEVEKAFLDAMRKWTIKLNDPRSHDDRDAATTAIGFLPEAKRVCLAIATTAGVPVPHRPLPRPSRTAPVPQQAATQTRCVRPRRHPVAIQACGRHFGSIFVGLWNVTRECGRFLAAIPGALVEIKDFVVDGIDRVEDTGVPKVAAVLILVIGILPLVTACVHTVRKVIQWIH